MTVSLQILWIILLVFLSPLLLAQSYIHPVGILNSTQSAILPPPCRHSYFHCLHSYLHPVGILTSTMSVILHPPYRHSYLHPVNILPPPCQWSYLNPVDILTSTLSQSYLRRPGPFPWAIHPICSCSLTSDYSDRGNHTPNNCTQMSMAFKQTTG